MTSELPNDLAEVLKRFKCVAERADEAANNLIEVYGLELKKIGRADGKPNDHVNISDATEVLGLFVAKSVLLLNASLMSGNIEKDFAALKPHQRLVFIEELVSKYLDENQMQILCKFIDGRIKERRNTLDDLYDESAGASR